MRALKWKSSEAFHPRKIVFLTSVKGKRIDILRSFFGNAPIHQEVNTVANKAAVEDLRRLGATVVELNTRDPTSAFISTNLSRQLTPILPRATRPSKRWRRSSPPASFIQTFDESIKKRKASSWMTVIGCDFRSAPSCSNVSCKDRGGRSPRCHGCVVSIGETQVEHKGGLGSVIGFPAIVVPGRFSSPTPTAALGVSMASNSWADPGRRRC
jgi:amidase